MGDGQRVMVKDPMMCGNNKKVKELVLHMAHVAFQKQSQCLMKCAYGSVHVIVAGIPSYRLWLNVW